MSSDAEKKLARIEEQNRVRVKRFMEKAKEQGKKQISAIISSEAHDTLCRIRDKAIQAGEQLSFGQIIENLLMSYNINTIVNINDNIKPIQETQTELPGPIESKLPTELLDFIKTENIALKGINDDDRVEDRYKIISKLNKLYPNRNNSQYRQQLSSDVGIDVSGNKFRNLQNRAKKWADDNGYTP